VFFNGLQIERLHFNSICLDNNVFQSAVSSEHELVNYIKNDGGTRAGSQYDSNILHQSGVANGHHSDTSWYVRVCEICCKLYHPGSFDDDQNCSQHGEYCVVYEPVGINNIDLLVFH